MSYKEFRLFVIFLCLSSVSTQFRKDKGAFPKIFIVDNSQIAYVGDEHVINCNLAKEDNRSIENDAYWQKGEDIFKYDTNQNENYKILIEPRRSFSESVEVRSFQLLLKNVTKSDIGTYTCFYNGANRTTVTLHVLDKPMREVIISSTGITDNLRTPSAPVYTNFSLNINVTDCCVSENVSEECRTSCVGQLGLKEACRPYVDKIDMCIINGKDHTSCCRRRLVPDNCIDLCTHALSDPALATMCASHFPEILQCIEEGHYSLPSPPRYVVAETLNGTSVRLAWSPPASNPDLVQSYTVVFARIELPASINFETSVAKMQPLEVVRGQYINATLSSSNSTHDVYSVAHDPDSVVFGISYDSFDASPKMILQARNESRVTVPANSLNYILTHLSPGSAYEIYMQAHSVYGSSLPSDIVEVFTRSPRAETEPPSVPSPQRPKPPAMTDDSITKCCTDSGIPEECMSLLCQIHNLASNTSQALIQCAQHFETAMKCIIDGRNHTSCCIKNRISPWCYGFCDGTSNLVTDFREANCLLETSQILTCIIQGHEILPSEPRNLKSLFTNDHSVTLSWQPPHRNTDMVRSYVIYYRESSPYPSPSILDYTYFTKVTNLTGTTYQLSDLHPDTWYELFVVADALNGSSLPSGALKLLTRPPKVGLTTTNPTTVPQIGSTIAPSTSPAGNETRAVACCESHRVDARCLPLCSYSVPVDIATDLLPRCPTHLQSVLACLADQRDHSVCCESRGVPPSCLPFCKAQLPSDLRQALSCIEHSFEILECFETGLRTLPSPPRYFYLTNRSLDTLSLAWDAPQNNPLNVTYKITYSSRLQIPTTISTGNSTYTLTNLSPNTTYRLSVEALNSYGSSLPSYVILATTLPWLTKVTTTSKALFPYGPTTRQPEPAETAEEPKSPPRPVEIEVLAVGTEYLTLAWKVANTNQPRNKDWIYRVYYTELSTDPDSNNSNADTVYSPFISKFLPSYHSINVSEPFINITNLTPDHRYRIFITSENKNYESMASETIIVRAAQHAAPQARIIVVPSNPVEAGKTVTMRCLTTGTPAPQVTWYHWLDNFQQAIWHEENFTMPHLHRTAMGQYKCVARNGILPNGKDFVFLKVAFSPLVVAKNAPVYVSRFETLRINCTVEAYPIITPKAAVWYKDGKFLTKGDPEATHQSFIYPPDETGANKYTRVMALVVKNVQPTDFGSYVCQATNKYGTDKDTIEVRQRDPVDPLKPSLVRNVSECCERLNVKPACFPACYYDDNLDALLQSNQNRLLQCLPDLSKIVHCSADGRDHSMCCDKRNVPGQCRRFCQGKIPPLTSPYMDTCLGYAKIIIDCYYNGSETIPTVPTNIKAEVVHGNHVKLGWNPPDKFARNVKYYTVYYRSAKDTSWKMKRVTAPNTRFSDLDFDTQYYFQIVAGNGHGSSQRSNIISLYTGSEVAVYQKVHKDSKPATMALGFIGATLLASVLGLALYILYKKRFSHLNHPVSFDNPGYEKEHVLDDMNPSPYSNGAFGGTLDLSSAPYGRASPAKAPLPYPYGNHVNSNARRSSASSLVATITPKPGPDDPLNGVSGWHLPSLHASSSSPSTSPPTHLPTRSSHLENSAILTPDDFDDDDGTAILHPSSLSSSYAPTRRERMIA